MSSDAERVLNKIFLEIDKYYEDKAPYKTQFGDYEKRTIAELKHSLRNIGLPVSGKKSELVSRLREFVSKDSGPPKFGRKKE